METEELLRQYAAGERDFAGVILSEGDDLTGVNLQGADLSGAVLCEVNLTDANLEGDKVTWLSIEHGASSNGCLTYPPT